MTLRLYCKPSVLSLMYFYYEIHAYLGFSGGSIVKNPPASVGDGRCGFDPWVEKIPWSRKWQPALVFLPG